MPVKILLKELRKSRKLSQNKLAQRVGMTLQNIQRIEYGDAKGVQFDTLGKLCEALDCQPGDLLIWIPDDEGNQEVVAEPISEMSNQAEKVTGIKDSKDYKPNCSFLTVVPEISNISQVPESA